MKILFENNYSDKKIVAHRSSRGREISLRRRILLEINSSCEPERKRIQRVQLHLFIFSIVFATCEDPLSLLLSRAFLYSAQRGAVRATADDSALIILLFSNESVDADGSVPAHKMHGTGCVCGFLSRLYLLSSPSLALSGFEEQKKELFRHNEPGLSGAFVESLGRSISPARKPG